MTDASNVPSGAGEGARGCADGVTQHKHTCDASAPESPGTEARHPRDPTGSPRVRGGRRCSGGAGQSSVGPESEPAPAGNEADRRLVETWVAGQASPRTRSSYRHQGGRLLERLGKPLADATVADLQAYVAGLGDLAPATIGLAVASIKSLWAFGRVTGALTGDPTATLQAPPIKNVLAERILEEDDVRRLLGRETDPRNKALLLLFYGAGLRRAELCALTWRDLAARGKDRGQATVFGKGGKTRTVMLYGGVWSALQALRGDADLDGPVFLSRKGGHLDPSAVWRVVKAAAARAELPPGVSPHWLRHSFASHALDNGAPLPLVQAGLGHASVATTSKYLHARPSDGAGRFLPGL